MEHLFRYHLTTKTTTIGNSAMISGKHIYTLPYLLASVGEQGVDHSSGVATEERLEQSLQGGMAQTGKGGRNELENRDLGVSKGTSDWAHFGRNIQDHEEESQNHAIACEVHYRWQLGMTVDSENIEEIKRSTDYWRQIMVDNGVDQKVMVPGLGLSILFSTWSDLSPLDVLVDTNLNEWAVSDCSACSGARFPPVTSSPLPHMGLNDLVALDWRGVHDVTRLLTRPVTSGPLILSVIFLGDAISQFPLSPVMAERSSHIGGMGSALRLSAKSQFTWDQGIMLEGLGMGRELNQDKYVVQRCYHIGGERRKLFKGATLESGNLRQQAKCAT
uniref:Uncharacterized protein n=1 Tax=Timema cristinae TaxID=61476 RepID=A0A7R9CAK6_TIMCR|nr:unnamed protein product [Timema cristinae]